MVLLAQHFENKDRSHSEWLRKRQWFIKAKQDKARRDDAQDEQDADILTLAADTMAATQIQIDEFRMRLDHYDEMTVEALMQNQILLDEVRNRLDAMLQNAYIMDDGRRVFKTELGDQVFDEFGVEIMPDDLDFDLIPDNAPTWENYSADKELEQQLIQERNELHEFQDKLDDARGKLNQGGITADELDDLDADLFDAMPMSLKTKVAGLDDLGNAPKMGLEFARKSSQIFRAVHGDIDAKTNFLP